MIQTVVQRPVDWQDTDASGHYHHSTVVRWVEAAEAVLLNSVGLGRLFGRIPRVRYEVDYIDRLWFGDTASIELSVERIGTTSLRYDFTITRIPASPSTPAGPRTIAARGALTAVHAPDAGGAQPWPADVVAALRGTEINSMTTREV
ncbi:acyl-CoA thioesterase [Nocardia nova]|jgi:acyl-CoA thioester hydrolase|uniref:acyl-CoA thioesterase n=1 Tax=Nocardia nova TaxID=37330 RepID=UPI0007A41A76|nr:acyl-CoA thioesterase [Nocardia nova]